MTPQGGVHVGLRVQLYTLYLHLQKVHGHHTRQGADLQQEAPILKAI